jgi:hypothetical protein
MKQNSKDRGPVEIDTLLVTDSGFDAISDKWTESMRQGIRYSREISTSRGLTDDEKLSLLRQVQARAATQLEPGLAVTMVVYADRPCDHTFLVTAA